VIAPADREDVAPAIVQDRFDPSPLGRSIHGIDLVEFKIIKGKDIGHVCIHDLHKFGIDGLVVIGAQMPAKHESLVVSEIPDKSVLIGMRDIAQFGFLVLELPGIDCLVCGIGLGKTNAQEKKKQGRTTENHFHNNPSWI
jgi:hypothetical protein